MIAVVQRVVEAAVYAEGRLQGRIGQGLLIYLAVDRSDLDAQGQVPATVVDDLSGRIVRQRMFRDDRGHFGKSLLDIGGAALVVSQFTLPGRTRQGTRPDFGDAAAAAPAQVGYEAFCSALRTLGVSVQTGKFAADMQVHSINDGPVTLLMGSRAAVAPWAQ